MRALISALAVCLLTALIPQSSWGLASSNVPLGSQLYLYLEKLSGFGLIDGEVAGLKPYSKAEAARLLAEAESNMERLSPGEAEFALEVLKRAKEFIPRETGLYGRDEEAPGLDWNSLAGVRLRYVFLDGRARDYTRLVNNPGREGFFGIGHIGRKFGKGNTARQSGTEGTPLFENNEGVVYGEGSNFELLWNVEAYAGGWLAALVEPMVISTHDDRDGSPYVSARLKKGYIKLGDGGLELEVGRDSNWFGQGSRGTTVLTNNAQNLDLVKISSPEPVGWRWLRDNIGIVKYSIFAARTEASGSGEDYRRPWLVGLKLAVKPTANFEIGGNYARQLAGPNVGFKASVRSIVFGGEPGDGSNALAGLDMRLRIPWLRDTTVYWEYMGEDSFGIFPYVESFLFGVFVPRLTPGGRDDLRVEVYLGNKVAYTAGQYPQGFTNGNMVMGHPAGGDTKDYFVRYAHHFSARNTLALEYIHTQRGRLGRLGDEEVEKKDAGRIHWSLPVAGDWDMRVSYGYENVRNFNLVSGDRQENHVVAVELGYFY